MSHRLPDSHLSTSGKPVSGINVPSALSPLVEAPSKGAGDLLLAGCKEGPNNFSDDAVPDGRPNGAFTQYTLKALRR